MNNLGMNDVSKPLLSLDGRGYADLALQRLVEVGVGARAAGSPTQLKAPTQDLLSAKALSQVYLSRQGREEIYP
jgi:hypothetical protein